MLMYVYQLSAVYDYDDLRTKTKLFMTKEGAYKALYTDVYDCIEEQRQHKSERDHAEKLLQTLNDIKQEWFDYEEINQYTVNWSDDDSFERVHM